MFGNADSFVQCSTTAEEERLKVDFNKIWQERQKPGIVSLVQRESEPREGGEPVKFDSAYATGCDYCVVVALL